MEWTPIPATTEFEVWRATEQGGPYVNLSGPVIGTAFVDTEVESGRWYWYYVRPTLTGSSESHANSAQTDPFCIHRPRILGSCPTTQATQVAVSGSYAYVADGASGLRVIDLLP